MTATTHHAHALHLREPQTADSKLVPFGELRTRWEFITGEGGTSPVSGLLPIGRPDQGREWVFSPEAAPLRTALKWNLVLVVRHGHRRDRARAFAVCVIRAGDRNRVDATSAAARSLGA